MVRLSSCGVALSLLLFHTFCLQLAAAWPVGDLVCNSPETGQLVSGDASQPYDTIVLPQIASPVDGFYTGYKITINSGVGRYSSVCNPTSQTNCAVDSVILNYVGATRTATVAFQGPTSAGDSYTIQRGCYEQPFGGAGSRIEGGSGTGAGTQNVTLNWKKLVNNGEIVGRPALTAAGSVVVGTSQGTLAKFSRDGVQEWSVYAGAMLAAPVIGRDGTIYVAASDRKLRAFTDDGMVLWIYNVPTPLIAAPTIAETTSAMDGVTVPGGVVIGDLTGVVTKLYLDGSVAWTFQTQGEVRAAAGITRDGRVVVGSTDTFVYCLDGRNGSLIWSYTAGQEIASKPLIQDVSIVFGTRQSVDPARLIALTPWGAARWALNVTSSIDSEPLEDPSTAVVYAASSDGKIWAVGPDGALRWRYVTGGAGGVCGNYDVLPDAQNSPSTRAKCPPQEIRVQGATSPTICAGTLVTTSQNKMVIGLGPADGELRWKYPTGRRIRSPPRCFEERDNFGRLTARVYTGSNDRYLYSLTLPTNT